MLSTIAIAGATSAPALAQGSKRSSRRSPSARVSDTGGTAAAPSSTSGSGSSEKSSHATGQGRNHGRRRHGRSKLGRTLSRAIGAHAPITAPTPNIEYSGPIYERTSSGQVVPYQAPVAADAVAGSTGGSLVSSEPGGMPHLLVPGSKAELIEGQAAAPMSAPHAVQEMIWAGNEIVGRPYVYGGGHRSFKSHGYDCSGTVSYALHGASLIERPMDSSEMMGWEGRGVGRWVTVFANPGHAYMTIAGLRLDTSTANDPSNLQGPRWRPLRPENHGFVKRHPKGL